jgi:hypothetical protein
MSAIMFYCLQKFMEYGVKVHKVHNTLIQRQFTGSKVEMWADGQIRHEDTHHDVLTHLRFSFFVTEKSMLRIRLHPQIN